MKTIKVLSSILTSVLVSASLISCGQSKAKVNAEKVVIEKTDEEWKKELTPDRTMGKYLRRLPVFVCIVQNQ